MPKLCAAYGCRGNNKGEPYTRMVKFPSEENERRRWIEAMPYNPATVITRRDIFCASHFDCAWTQLKVANGLSDLQPFFQQSQNHS